MKTVADLRAQKNSNAPLRRPERSMTLCLSPDLVAEAQALTSELGSLPGFDPTDEDGEASGPPRRLGDPTAAAARDRAAAIRARLAEVLDEMAEHEGELRLRANISDGEWRRWVNEHPAREEDKPGHDRDLNVATGICNADSLIDNLSTFVHRWNGEPLTATDWVELFEPVVGSPDLADMARNVITLYERRLDFPQWRSALSSNLKRLNGLSSPANSASATSDSTAGSLDRSSEATTETDDK